MISMFGLPDQMVKLPLIGEINPMILYSSLAFAIVGAAYAIFGGLRAVAVSDTYSGVLILGLALFITFVALKAINFDFSGIPRERLTLIGAPTSDIPFTALFTGMIFIQIFYWSTNQTITQRAMASPSVKEAQKGIFAAAMIRLLIVPPIIVIPGIVAYKLYGQIDKDLAYGTIVSALLPTFMSGAFAAAIAAAILTTFNSILNASAALWVCDIHESYVDKKPNVRKLSFWVSIVMVILGLMMVPFFATQESLIETVQKLYGLLSMPILAAFAVGLLFKNVEARAVIIAVIFGVFLYYWMLNPLLDEKTLAKNCAALDDLTVNALCVGLEAKVNFITQNVRLQYIHLMAINLLVMVGLALGLNRFVFKQKAVWDANNVFGKNELPI